MNDELIESYGLMLMRLAVSMGLQRADAEDVAQDVLVKLLASGKAFADEEHRKAWLIRVGVNACKDVYRRRARRKDRLANDGERVPEPAVSEPGFEHVEIEQIIAALDADDRAFLYLSCYEGMNSSEIAAIAGAAPSTIRSRLGRIRHVIRKEWRR